MFIIKNIFLLLLSGWCFGLNGYELASQIDNRKTPIDSKMNLEMHLTNKKGKTRSYTLYSVAKDNATKQMIWFIAPPDDKGISFLKIEYDNKDDEMRIWLPAFKKIRRISATKRSDSFMGSDMSYEDLSSRQLNEHTFKIINQEIYDSIPCYLLEAIPNKNILTQYSRHITWVDTTSLLPIKEESFDKNGILLKEKIYNYINIKGYDVLSKIYVKNSQKQHSTAIQFKNIELDTKIKDTFFHERNLKRLPK